MRSDNARPVDGAGALGLGAATVDVAYTAMNSAIDVVNQIKSKLVAAREPGVDRTKVQSEITELQKQLKSVADSASFSGQNWLSIDSSAASYNGTKLIVVVVHAQRRRGDRRHDRDQRRHFGHHRRTKLFDASAAAAADQAASSTSTATRPPASST